MGINEILKNNFPAIITLIGALLAVIITQFFNWLNKKSEFYYQHNLKKTDQQIAFENNEVIKPVLGFLEKELRLITKIYQKGLNREVSIEDELSEHILEMSMVGARVRILGNNTLNETYEEFTRLRIPISCDALNEEGNKDINTAFNNMKKAELLASKIISEIR
jgi:hypothetical protein